MASTVRNVVIRSAVIVTIGTLTVLGLAGCKDSIPTATPSTSNSVTPTESTSPVPETSTSPTPSAAASHAPGTPISVDCNGLISRQAMYDFNPNYSLQAGSNLKTDSAGSVARGYKGLACSWINQTSGNLIFVSVAHPAASDLATLKNTAARGTAVSGIGDAAFFSKTGQTGQLQVFSGPFWISTSSDFYGTPEDARQLAKDAVASLI
ncbi:MAG: hypothetical protein ABI053_06700 [Lacisediminihabitans sp.]